MKPTRDELQRAWGPLGQLVLASAHVGACEDMHARGAISELTAKLHALDALRERVRDLGGRDFADDYVRGPIVSAASGDFSPLHSLIFALAGQITAIERTDAALMDLIGVPKIKHLKA